MDENKIEEICKALSKGDMNISEEETERALELLREIQDYVALVCEKSKRMPTLLIELKHISTKAGISPELLEKINLALLLTSSLGNIDQKKLH